MIMAIVNYLGCCFKLKPDSFRNMHRGKSKFNWSKVPGCFERHLQRRNNNIVFPESLRNVSEQEFILARQKDARDRSCFIEKYNTLKANVLNTNFESSATEVVISNIQQIQELIRYSSEIGGDIKKEKDFLERLEQILINGLQSKSPPEAKEYLDTIMALAHLERHPFTAQASRQETPIKSDQVVYALLCENEETINNIGHLSRRLHEMSHGHFSPSRDQVKEVLDKAVMSGLSVVWAKRLLNAFEGKIATRIDP